MDTLVTGDNGFLITNVYRKPTHTDKYLDYTSHHDKNHKASTALSLLHRAATLPNTNEGKQAESKHVIDALVTNGYHIVPSRLHKFLFPRIHDLDHHLCIRFIRRLSTGNLCAGIFIFVIA